jgi:hypothetical protein
VVASPVPNCACGPGPGLALDGSEC